MLYYLLLSLCTLEAAHLLHVYIWRRKGRERQAKTGHDRVNNAVQKTMKL